MESITFELQITEFVTNDDSWENLDLFWCIFNSGFFKNTSNGYCTEWEDKGYWHIGQVQENSQKSYDVVQMPGNVYRSQEEALNAIEDEQ